MTEPSIHLLIVDDEAALRSVIAERLTEQGFHVTEAESGEKALALLNEFAFDIVISDLRLPGIDGHHVIESALERYPGIIAIVVTGFGTVKNAVDAIKRGATDFVAKPFQFDELLHVLRSALEQRRLKNENAYLRQQLDERFGLGAMIGQSPRMRELFQLIETIAPTATTILINGEKVAEGRIDHTQGMVFSADETAGVGMDDATPVTTDYKERDNAFTGKIIKVTVDVKPIGAAVKAEADLGQRTTAVKKALSD